MGSMMKVVGQVAGAACGDRTDSGVGVGAPSSDRVVITQTREEALRLGDSEAQAWRAAVGAYLERHPGSDIADAERIVSVLIRPYGGGALYPEAAG